MIEQIKLKRVKDSDYWIIELYRDNEESLESKKSIRSSHTMVLSTKLLNDLKKQLEEME